MDRSYGSRVVEAVMDNSADFGLTQLPVEEKRLQVVNIHRDEIRLIVPARHPLAAHKTRFARRTWSDFPCCCRKQGKTRTRLNEWLEPVEDEIRISMELDSTEMMKRFVMAGLGVTLPGGLQLPRGDRRRKDAGDSAGAGAHDPPPGPDLPQGQGALQSGPGFYSGRAG